ncbi:MAG TPA: hypothetical protein DET40_24230 [Lentisphaeria bacterium]|nr:MAG: hypothetical protein A2X45_21195 [Lentisphaerae bacterium GWF2_50_93]HCE46668.1 hypothetical protein [Lentisphaeria bacterium]
MKNLFLALAGAAVLVLVAGCGSLDQKVGGPQMSNPSMDFARQIPAGQSFFSISCDDKELSTSKWASRVYPIFPVFYWSTLGNFSPAPNYGLRTSTIFFPVFVVMRDSIYDDKGLRVNSETMFNFALAIGYEDNITPRSSDFKIGLLWIPGIGPFLGAGPEFFQFLWIPFTDFK